MQADYIESIKGRERFYHRHIKYDLRRGGTTFRTRPHNKRQDESTRTIFFQEDIYTRPGIKPLLLALTRATTCIEGQQIKKTVVSNTAGKTLRWENARRRMSVRYDDVELCAIKHATRCKVYTATKGKTKNLAQDPCRTTIIVD